MRCYTIRMNTLNKRNNSLHRCSMKWLTAALLLAIAAGANATTAELQKAMRTATFEVVMKKPENDPLTYEKPLPLELLPYMERTDKYRSIGTAFSLGHNTYVTAGHVLNACINSQYGPPSLRDADGKVYAIDQIVKYSVHEDFAVFTVSGDPAPQGLAVNRTPHINDPVFAVGNALGDGVVIRDGLYTSDTPEEQDGRWKWIRFSAPASPGNSGGPLVDASGAVIGIVIGKSPNENLNYSLPISIVLDAPPDKALFDTRYLMSSPYLHGTLTHSLKTGFALPKKWPAFVAAYLDMNAHDLQTGREELFKKYADSYFPVGGDEVLFGHEHKYNPQMIIQQPDERWSSEAPGFDTTDLPGNGFIKEGSAHGVMLFRLHRPDDSADPAFYHDSKAFMDMALKGLDITRQVGSDAVRVVSLGPALHDDTFTDKYGRIWQRRVWALPYLDSYVVAMMLPTPEGYSGFLQYGPSLTLNGINKLVEEYTTFIDLSYWGTVAQWQSFLKQRGLIPECFAHLQFNSSNNGSELKISSGRITLNASPALLKISGNSPLGMDMNYSRDKDKLAWNIGSVWLFSDAQLRSYLAITRYSKPPASMKREYQDDWDNLLDRRSPYDGRITRETTETWSATTVVAAPSTETGKLSDSLMYSIKLGMENFVPSEEMNKLLKTARDAISINERGTGALSADQVTVQQQSEQYAALQTNFEMLKQFILEMGGKFAQQVTDKTIDDRGRTQADDFRDDLVTMELRDKAGSIAQSFNKAISERDMPDAQSQMNALDAMKDTIRDRYAAICAYWDGFRGIAQERTLWQHALERDHLPANTAHSDAVIAAESRLHDITPIASELNTTRIASMHELINTMIADRNALARRVGSDKSRSIPVQYTARQTACPEVDHSDSAAEQTVPIMMPKENISDHASASTAANHLVPAMLTGHTPNIDDYYPAQSKRNGEQGFVVISIKIDANGCPLSAGVIASSGSDALDTAALKFVELLNYHPATMDGKPVSNIQPVAINFKLDNSRPRSK